MYLTFNEAACETKFIPLGTGQCRSQHRVGLVTMFESTKHYISSASRDKMTFAYHARPVRKVMVRSWIGLCQCNSQCASLRRYLVRVVPFQIVLFVASVPYNPHVYDLTDRAPVVQAWSLPVRIVSRIE